METEPIKIEAEVDHETTVGLLKLELRDLAGVREKLNADVEEKIARIVRLDVVCDTIRDRLKEFGEEPVQPDLPEFSVEDTTTVDSGDNTTVEVED